MIMKGDKGLKENIAEYIELQKEKMLLDAADKTSNIVAEVVLRFSYLILVLFSALFLSIVLAKILNQYTQSEVIGYLVMAAVYLSAFLFIFYKAGKWMGNFIACEFLNILYHSKEKNNENL